MEFLRSLRLFTWGILKRFYWMLPTFLVDPFDVLSTLFGVEYNPPTWIVWALFSLGLFLAASLAYHEIRVKSQAGPDAVADHAIARLRKVEFSIGKRRVDAAAILHALARDLASGVSSHHIEQVLRKRLNTKTRNLPWPDIRAELFLANIIRQEHRQPAQADASGIFRSFWALPYDIYLLTDFGKQVVGRLRDTVG